MFYSLLWICTACTFFGVCLEPQGQLETLKFCSRHPLSFHQLCLDYSLGGDERWNFSVVRPGSYLQFSAQASRVSWQWLWYLDFCQDCFFFCFLPTTSVHMSLILSSTDADTPSCTWVMHFSTWFDTFTSTFSRHDAIELSTPSVTLCMHSSTAFGTPSVTSFTHFSTAFGTWMLRVSSIFCSILDSNAFSCSVSVSFTLVMSFYPLSALIWQSLCMHCKPRECHLWQGHLFHFSWALCISCKTIYCTHSILPGRVCFCQPLARFGCSLCNSTFPYFRPWRPWLPSCHHWNAVVFHEFFTQGQTFVK